MLKNQIERIKGRIHGNNGEGGEGGAGGGGAGGAGGAAGSGSGDAGGSGDANWRDGLPEDIRDSQALKDISDVPALARNFIESQAFVGSSIRPPAKDATTEELAAFAQRVVDAGKGKVMISPNWDNAEEVLAFDTQRGVPVEEKGYTLPEFEDKITLNEQLVTTMRAKAKSLRFTNAQFQGIMKDIAVDQSTRTTNFTNAHAEDMQGIKNDWGHQMDRNISISLAAAQEFEAPDDVISAIEKGFASGKTLRHYYAIAMQTMGEDNALSKQRGGAAGDTPLELRERIGELEDRIATLDSSKSVPNMEKQKIYTDEIIKIRRRLNALKK